MPSRTDVPEYQKLRSMVHEIVGRINGQFGTLTYVPIYHLDTSLSFTELCALYAVTDVALVSSLVSACASGGGGGATPHLVFRVEQGLPHTRLYALPHFYCSATV